MQAGVSHLDDVLQLMGLLLHLGCQEQSRRCHRLRGKKKFTLFKF